ncbi:MAG: hypothetical protein L6437_00775 [Kiritimatiellae bacterium]|nr:hypothetical protein [Verrucomicrobiota bacterium]MCG2658765.1 hypothetical protein [Kiritimatiellia bacterium]
MSDQLQFDFEGRDRNQDRAGGAGPELPRDPSASGYAAFGTEQAAAVRAMEERFGVILNKNVRLKLIGWDEVFEGRLILDQLLYPATRKEGLRLRIGKVPFDYTDIEYCFRKEE